MDGHEIGELVPPRRPRRFVSRAEFAEASRAAPESDLAAFRADQDAAYDHGTVDPHAEHAPGVRVAGGTSRRFELQ